MRRISMLLAALLLSFFSLLPSAGAEQPVYLNIAFHCDDFITEQSQRVIQRVARILQRNRLRADFWLTGLQTKTMMESTPDVLHTLRETGMGFCYRGDYEVPYPTLGERIRDLNWDDAVETAISFEIHEQIPVLDEKNGEVFFDRLGGLAYVTYNLHQIPAASLEGQGAAILHARSMLGVTMVGPIRGLSPAWEMGLLRWEGPPRVLYMPNMLLPEDWRKAETPARRPEDVLDSYITNLPNDKPNLVTIVFKPSDFHLAAPWNKCYTRTADGGGNPFVLIAPPSRPEDEQRELWRRFESLVQFIAKQRRVKVVVAEELKGMVETVAQQRALKRPQLTAASDFIVQHAEVPRYLKVDDEYYSCADLFQGFARALEQYAHQGQLSEEVPIWEILGPTEVPYSLGFNGRGNDIPRTVLSAQCVLDTAKELSPDITNRIPSVIPLVGREQTRAVPIAGSYSMAARPPLLDMPLGSERVRSKAVANPLEFLYLMAQEYHEIARKGRPGTVIFRALNMAVGTPVATEGNIAADFGNTQEWLTGLQEFTYKPAKFKREFAQLEREDDPLHITVAEADQRSAKLDDLRARGVREPVYVDFDIACVYDILDVEEGTSLARAAELFHKYGVKWDNVEMNAVVVKNYARDPNVIEALNRYHMPLSYNPLTSMRFLDNPPDLEGVPWDEAVKAARALETQEIDLLTGKLNPNNQGGYAYVKEKLGRQVALTSTHQGPVGGPTEAVLREMGILGKSEMPQVNGLRVEFMPNSILSQLRTGSPTGNRTIWEDAEWPSHPVEVIKRMVEDLPRDQSHAITQKWHGFQFCCAQGASKPLEGGRLPVWPFPTAMYPSDDAEKVWKVYEELLAYCAKNPELKVIWREDVPLPPPSGDVAVSRELISQAAHTIRESWTGLEKPGTFGPLSINEAFQSLARSLATFASEKKLPDAAVVTPVRRRPLVPARVTALPPDPNPWLAARKPSRPEGRAARQGRDDSDLSLRFPEPMSLYCPDLVDGDAVVEAAVATLSQLSDRLPGAITLRSGREASLHEFLYLMAQVYGNIEGRGKPGMVLLVDFGPGAI